MIFNRKLANIIEKWLKEEEMIILTDFYNHSAQMLYLKLGYQIHDLALSKNINHKHTE